MSSSSTNILGWSNYNSGSYSEAITYFISSISAGESYSSFYGLGLSYLSVGQTLLALEALLKASELKADKDLLSLIGRVLRCLKRDKESLAYIRRSISLSSPDHTDKSHVPSIRKLFHSRYDRSNWLHRQNCYICGDSHFVIFNNSEPSGFDYPTGICSSCGHIQQSFYMNPSTLDDFYANYYRKIYLQPRSGPEFFQYQRSKGPQIRDAVFSVHNNIQSVLEVGCGSGGILSTFVDSGSNVLGLDFDEKYLDIARAHNIPVLRGSLDVLNPNQLFDCIILNHVVEHIPYPRDFLLSVQKYLTPGGVIYIEVPSVDHIYNGSQDFDLFSFFTVSHCSHFTSHSLPLLLETSELNIECQTSRLSAVCTSNRLSNNIVPDKLKMSKSLVHSSNMLRHLLTYRTLEPFIASR